MFSLPWPPSNNRYYRHIAKGAHAGRTLLSFEGRDYRAAVQAVVAGQGVQKPLEGRLIVRIWAHPPDARRRDVDNLFKSVLDSLQHANVFLDDSQIDHLSIHRCGKLAGGKLDVFVEEIKNEI
jgi:crossover junction endodeoxyribonuclease RusA